MIEKIKVVCDKLISDFSDISDERKHLLGKLSDYIQDKINHHQEINLVYICTHNSRRSHFGQIWSKVAAEYYGIKNITTFSGGTEATAFNMNAINAISKVGFVVVCINESSNSLYHVFYDLHSEPIICFSKVYSADENPKNNFAAIMTCGDAEENCPFIPGVEFKIATTYQDPKAFDNTPLQDEMYNKRSLQIAQECLYVFSKIAK